ncbi:MAG: hypothetical protein U0694_17780 [Anaerolineae bacterium]
MYHLATVFPPAARLRRLPLSRDQLMLLLAAINQLFLGVDIYLAHSISGTINGSEWIPIIFGFSAGIILLLAGLIALRNRPLATILANLVFVVSIVIGLMGVFFHLVRAGIIGGGSPLSDSVGLLVWAPPFLGPIAFVLVGALGISAAWVEDPPDSGRLRLLANRHLQLPYSKTRAYFLIVGIFALITVISSTFDHARTNFANPAVWLPASVGVFATAVAIALGFMAKPSQSDLTTYTLAMVMMIVVGLVGALLHLNSNLVAQGTIVVERFVRGSPLLAPLLYANVGLLGLVTLLDPTEHSSK